MDFLKPEQLPLFVILVVPGFISLKVYAVLVPTSTQTPGRDVLDAICYGALNAGIWFFPFAFWLLPLIADRPLPMLAAGFTILVLSPIALAVGYVRLLKWFGNRGWLPHPTPTAWDGVFGEHRSAWVRVRLKGGAMAGGFYGRASWSSSFPHPADLFLQEAWRLAPDGSFEQRAERTSGLWVPMANCELIEFFETEGSLYAERVSESTVARGLSTEPSNRA